MCDTTNAKSKLTHDTDSTSLKNPRNDLLIKIIYSLQFLWFTYKILTVRNVINTSKAIKLAKFSKNLQHSSKFLVRFLKVNFLSILLLLLLIINRNQTNLIGNRIKIRISNDNMITISTKYLTKLKQQINN